MQNKPSNSLKPNFLEMNLVEFPQENEIGYLMTKSNCFFLAQGYQENQTKMTQLKLELKEQNFTLQKLSSVSLSKGKDLFMKNSLWIPVTNSNFLVYSNEIVTETKLNFVVKKLIPLMAKSQVLPLFLKKDLLLFDTNRYNQVSPSLENKSSFLAVFLKNQIALPFFCWVALSRNFLLLLNKSIFTKQKS